MTMNRTLIALSAAAIALPGMASAQNTSTVTINGNVIPACVLGTPTNASLPLGTLTGPDGRLAAALAASTPAAPAAQTTIDNAWCNTPSTITLTASPLTMPTPPAYAQQTGFARAITYTANLTNWSAPVTNRPLAPGNAVPVTTNGAQAASPSLGVVFSNLTPLIGGSENANAYLEAGGYSAVISITLAAAN